MHQEDIGAQGNENLNVSIEECPKNVIHDVFGSDSSNTKGGLS